jgi:hypothetical protein
MYIYDYSSFTSRLIDNRTFIDHLSMFCKGVNIFILDTHQGPLRYDLGLLISEYNNVVNFECPYDVTTILGLSESLLLHMASSGPLGVPGNIVSSTFTHGLVQAEITGSVNRGNAIGDDAIGLRDVMGLPFYETLDLHRSIGAIEGPKTCRWLKDSVDEGHGWHYVKRPLDRIDGGIATGWMPDFPNYPVLLGITDDTHTVPPMAFDDRRIMCAKQVGRFFDRCLRSCYEVSRDERDFTLTIFRYLYFKLRLDVHGSWPNASRKANSSSKKLKLHFVPPLVDECFDRSWIRIILEQRTVDAVVLLPKETLEDECGLPDDPIPGDSFTWRGSKILGTLGGLGIMEKRKIYEDVLVTEDDYDRIVRLIEGKARPVYQYTFVTVPWYWNSLCMLMPSEPTPAEVTYEDDDMDW